MLRSLRHSRDLAALAGLALAVGCSAGGQVSPSGNQGVTPQKVDQVSRLSHPEAARLATLVRPDVFKRVHLGTRGPSTPVETPEGKAKWKKSVFVTDFEGGPSYLGAVYQLQDKKNGQIIGTITDSVNPGGLDADSKGNLYVAATGSSSVNIYAPGHYTATSTLTDAGEYPVSVAVCPNGTVYVANIYTTSFYAGNIETYAPGSTSPTSTVPDPNIYSARFAACDKNNVLWYDFIDSSFYTGVASFDGTSVTEYGSLGIGFPGGVRITAQGDYIVISDQYAGLEFFHNPPQAGDPFQTISCPNVSDPVSFSFDKPDIHAYIADAGNGDVAKFNVKCKLAYTLGGGTLVVPTDAYAFPPGNT